MTETLNNAALFLINTLFDLYLLILMLRLILTFVRADFFNPISLFVFKMTQPLIAPLRKIIPNAGTFETSTLVILLILDILKFMLIGLVTVGFPSNLFGLLLISFADIFKLLLNVFFYTIIAQAILSWVQMGYSPITKVLEQITAPIMRPIARLVPPVSGFDLSPIPALILLQLMIIVIANPLIAAGMEMTFGYK